MVENDLQIVEMDQETPPPDWHSVAQPLVGLRSLALVALLVPLLLAAGVYWLRLVPVGTGSRMSDNVVEVHLLNAQQVLAQRPDVPHPEETAVQSPAQQLVEDPNRTIPEETVALSPSEPVRAPPARQTPSPSSSAAVNRVSLDQEAAKFLKALESHISRYQRYPEAARRDRVHGKVQLVFSMLRDGTVTDVRIESSSGYSVLDQAAIDTIRRAAPLPRIPAELPERLDILFPTAFDLP
jgi:periplasmic protein TonB